MAKQFKINNQRTTNLMLFGISSMEKSYKLCWELNHLYQFQFINTVSHRVFDENNQLTEFLLFVDNKYFPNNSCYLLENKTNGNILCKQYQIADYFFVLNASIPENKLQAIQDKIKKLSSVQAVFDIGEEQLKEPEKFFIKDTSE